MRVFLIGYMASGKSTLGKRLAQELQLPFVDLDEAIEEKAGAKVAAIIKAKGELHFRKLESQTLQEVLSNFAEGVFALGGGTPVFFDHMELLGAHGQTVFLDVPISELARRLKGDLQRPLIQNQQDVLEFIAKHMFERRPFYSLAKHRVAGPSITTAQIKAVLD